MKRATENQKYSLKELIGGKQISKNQKEASNALLPLVTNNEDICILERCDNRDVKEGDSSRFIDFELIIKNTSANIIDYLVFEAVFNDLEGNIIETVEKEMYDLEPNSTRNIRISCLGREGYKAQSYYIRVIKTVKIPQPVAIGNDKINIISHGLLDAFNLRRAGLPARIEMAVKNISQSTIATVIFEATFLDLRGNIINTVTHKETDLKSLASRSFFIKSSVNLECIAKSYSVKIIHTTTADVEKVQLLNKKRQVNQNGDEQIIGMVKNISEVNTNAVILATFYNHGNQCVGNRAIILNDIDPDTIRHFQMPLDRSLGDMIKNIDLQVGELIE